MIMLRAKYYCPHHKKNLTAVQVLQASGNSFIPVEINGVTRFVAPLYCRECYDKRKVYERVEYLDDTENRPQ